MREESVTDDGAGDVLEDEAAIEKGARGFSLSTAEERSARVSKWRTLGPDAAETI